jgi:serum/glucocorticoid-regulated kinase 2
VISLHNKKVKGQVGLEDFKLIRVVGRGSFGKVILVKKKDTGRPYAMKTLNKEIIAKRNQRLHTQSKFGV